jgi:DNA-binding IclR family transcriptional regulator
LARKADLDTGTTRRLLQTLLLRGFVGHNDATGQYFLTRKVIELSSAARTDHNLKEIGARYLRELANETGATSFLWQYAEGFALCIDRVRAATPNVDAAWFAVGAKTTLNGGGGPRVMLAFLSEDEKFQALSQKLIVRTPASISNPVTLVAHAELTKTRGWDLAIDDFVVGIAGLGVPIFTRDGTLAGSISISTLTTVFGDLQKPAYLDQLRAAALQIGNQL